MEAKIQCVPLRKQEQGSIYTKCSRFPATQSNSMHHSSIVHTKTLGAGAGILLFPAMGHLRGACNGGIFSKSAIGLGLDLGFLVDISTFVDVDIILCMVGIGMVTMPIVRCIWTVPMDMVTFP